MATGVIKKDSIQAYMINFDVASDTLQGIDEADMNDTNHLFAVVYHGSLGYLPVDNDGYLWTFRRAPSGNGVQFFTRVTSSNYVLYMRKYQGGAWGSWVSVTFS